MGDSLRVLHVERPVVGERPRGGATFAGTAELLERGAELERVAAAITDPGRVLVVEGEAGIGKSAILRAAAAIARRMGAHVFSARGGLLERG
ncbi:MAG: hypothetical protein LC685_04130 [Actinobacteria bacterium]|nr:hypothetical protein [Actinomycetota bacterium]